MRKSSQIEATTATTKTKNQIKKMNAQTATKISGMFLTMTTAQLVEAFNATEGNNAKEIPTVRGWIMDELEKRNPAAFMAWIDGDAFKGPEFYF